MKNKLLLTLTGLALIAGVIVADDVNNDMTKGYDFTVASGITASKLNQLVDQAIPAANRGMIIYTNAAPTNTDFTLAPRLTRFIWLDSSQNPPSIYTYNTNVSSWQSSGIADGSVVLAKLATSSVNSDKIVDGSVTGTDIAGTTIANANMADNSITSSKIQDGEVKTADILDGTVSVNDLATNSVGSAQIIDSTITTVDIQDASVTQVKLAENSVGSLQLTNNAVVNTNIAQYAVAVTNLSAGSAYQTYRVNSGATAVEWIDSPFLQYASAQTATSYSSGTTLATDNTPFTVSIGTEVSDLNISFTPKKAGSKLLIRFHGPGYLLSGYTTAAGIFIDGTNVSTARIYNFNGTLSAILNTTVSVSYDYTTVSTTALAIRIRISSDISGGLVLNKNGASTAQNGTMYSTLTITEVQ